MAEIRNVNYNNRDFDGLRESIVDYLKQYYPTTFSDFSNVSPLMAIVDAIAYVGDGINYSQNKAFNDIFMSQTQNRTVVFNWVKNFGYIPKSARPSYAYVDISATFALSSLSASYAFTLKRGTQFLSNTDPQIIFELKDDVSFLNATTADSIFTYVDDALVITKTAIAIAGQTTSESFAVGTTPIPFYSYELSSTNVIEILSLTSSDDKKWYEVPTLAQDYIIQGLRNPDTSVSAVPYFLTLLNTERRFEVNRTSASSTILQFGSSYVSNENIVTIPNPEDFVVYNQYRGQEENFIVKPSNIESFLNNSSMGVMPINVTMTATYRIGGGSSTNVPAGTIDTLRNRITEEANPTFAAANRRNYNTVIQSITVTNPLRAEGGEDEESTESIIRNAKLQQYAQQRLISEQDYEFFTKQMPPSYGTIYRSKAKYNKSSGNIELSILSKNIDGQLELPHIYLKNNLITYFNLIRPLDDSIKVQSGNIINLGLLYTLSVDRGFDKSAVIIKSINTVQDFLSIKNFDMDEPISKSEVSQLIQTLDGVLSVSYLSFINITGAINDRTYSSYSFDVESNTKNNFIYPTMNSMFEIKYPKYDIIVQVV